MAQGQGTIDQVADSKTASSTSGRRSKKRADCLKPRAEFPPAERRPDVLRSFAT